MKLGYFEDYKLGVVMGGTWVDVTPAVSHLADSRKDLMRAVIEKFADCRPAIEDYAKSHRAGPFSTESIRPPLPKPRNIVCMAVNYMEDGTLKAPAPINAFHKSPSAIIGSGDTMVLPDVPASVFEGEAELAVVIGKRARHVKAAEAMDYVFGYMNFIDGSARGLPPPGNVFFQMKSRDTFAPIGPWIVTADEIKNPQNLQIRLWNNGEIRQNFNTSDMAHDISRCIEWVTSIQTLEPGDILATGTNHRGLHAFQDGDKIEIETDGLGRLTFHVRDDLKRTWEKETRLQRLDKGLEAIAPQTGGKYAKSKG